jgi:hypothetical protein
MFGFDLFGKYFFGIFNMKRKQKTEVRKQMVYLCEPCGVVLGMAYCGMIRLKDVNTAGELAEWVK